MTISVSVLEGLHLLLELAVGQARAAALASGLFSTMTVWPNRFDKWSATVREKMSVPPPGAYVTMILIGREGYSCACAGTAAVAQTAIAATILQVPRNFMLVSADTGRGGLPPDNCTG